MDLAKNPNRSGPRLCCARLRWKGMFVDVEPDPLVPNPRDGFCWGSVTMPGLGPAGGVGDVGRCGAGERGCFEEL